MAMAHHCFSGRSTESSIHGRKPHSSPFTRISVALAIVLLTTTGCIHTRQFRNADGRVIPGSIASMEFATIGGISQSLWFRGISTSNPPLVLLHGGPGASESALFRRYNSELERRFLVVYWEQRGTGRSYRPHIPIESMTIERFLCDLDEVVELVRHRFGKDKVILAGHSWGTVLGTIYASRYPEKVSAYVGIAQIADVQEGRQLSYGFAISEANRRASSGAIRALERIGPPPYSSIDEVLAVGRWVERFGGVFHKKLSTEKLILAALSTDEANLIDLIKFGRGNRFSLEQLENEFSTLNLVDHYRFFKVPTFFLLGRYDWQVPSVLAQRYFENVTAPVKRLVWFEKSAHNPPFEEPAKFNDVMINEVLPLVEPP